MTRKRQLSQDVTPSGSKPKQRRSEVNEPNERGDNNNYLNHYCANKR